jgi:hypothetical protein
LIGGSFVAAAGVEDPPDDPDPEPASEPDPDPELPDEPEPEALEAVVVLLAEPAVADAPPASGVDSASAGGGSDGVEELCPGCVVDALGLEGGSTSFRCGAARGPVPCGLLAAAAPSSTPNPRNPATSAAEKRAGSGSEPLRPPLAAAELPPSGAGEGSAAVHQDLGALVTIARTRAAGQAVALIAGQLRAAVLAEPLRRLRHRRAYLSRSGTPCPSDGGSSASIATVSCSEPGRALG